MRKVCRKFKSFCLLYLFLNESNYYTVLSKSERSFSELETCFFVAWKQECKIYKMMW
jgi:hypothetical protein